MAARQPPIDRPSAGTPALALCLALFACAPPPAPAPTAPPVPTPEQAPLSPAELEALFEGDYSSLSGTWHSDYGTVQLMFDDNLHFSGIYAEGSFTGYVDVERGALVFEWADDGSAGLGVWEIIDQDTLRGSWGLEASERGGEWTLVR